MIRVGGFCTTVVACSTVVVLACGTGPGGGAGGAADSGSSPTVGSGASSGGGGGSVGFDGGGSGVGSFTSGSNGGGSQNDAGETGGADAFVGCATTTERATQLPLDLYFMLDTSGSMNDLIARGQSKWNAVVKAMTAFVADPASAGIGVGLQYFPLTSAGVPGTCSASPQCAAAGPCLLKICGNAVAVIPCDFDADCGGGPCVAVGECELDHNVLCNPGTPCGMDPNGFPLGVCQALAVSSCAFGDSCAPADYASPAQPVAQLPFASAAVTASLAMRQPNGNTPTAAALQGAITAAKVQARTNPGHTVVVVLATDGIPDECAPSDIPGIAGIASAAAGGTPAIRTFAIGVFTPDAIATGTADLDQLAAAGGTTKAFVINTNQNVELQFAAALAAIRGASLPCEYALPSPAGGVPDYRKLNVQHTLANGTSATLPYVEDAAACNPTSGGWYYDADPAEGGTPTKILVCPASCGTLKTDVTGRVDVVLGCATVLR